MNRDRMRRQIEELESAVLRRLGASGRNTQRPSCYREAKFDAEGHLLPSSREDLLEVAGIHTDLQQGRVVQILEQYRQPTAEWPQGKDHVINERIAHATRSKTEVLREEQLAVKADPKASDLSIEFRLLTAGLMNCPPSAVTRSALAIFHPLGLYSLLAIDPPPSDASQRTPPRTADVEERQLREYEGLLPVLRREGGRIIDTNVLEMVLTRLHKMLDARVVVSLSKVAQEQRASQYAQSMIAVREHGWTARSIQFRREKLLHLVKGLRDAEPSQWPISRIAALFLASEKDWACPPCPQLVAKYRDRQDKLEDLLKKDLTRSGPIQRTAAKKR